MSMNWGMANRLARIIKADGRAVMLADSAIRLGDMRFYELHF